MTQSNSTTTSQHFSTTSQLDAALAAIADGWRIFPLHTPLFDDPHGYLCTCEEYRHSDLCKERDAERKGQKPLYLEPDEHCPKPGKHPRGVKSWTKESTQDVATVTAWWAQWPNANVGGDCGGSAQLALDADLYKESYAADTQVWQDETRAQRTGGGGLHVIFDATGHSFGNQTGNLPTGIDIRGKGGFIVLPGSLHASGRRYAWLNELPYAPIPKELVALLSSPTHQTASTPGDADVSNSLDLVGEVCGLLDIELTWQEPNADGAWLAELPTCPFNPQDDPHADGDGATYVMVMATGAIVAGCHHARCAERIKEYGGTGWAYLKELAGASITGRIKLDFRKWGYTGFRLNSADGQKYHGDRVWTEGDEAKLMMKCRDAGYSASLRHAAMDVVTMVSYQNEYHPVRDYLRGLVWDGQNHIRTLAGFVGCDDPKVKYSDGKEADWFAVCLYRWLVAAAGKVLSGESPVKVQNAMLTLVGKQSLGKSTFARWLCPIPSAFREGALDPDNADHLRSTVKTLIWEISELDSVTRRRDAAALRGILTQGEVTSRWPYAKYDVTKPVCASFIGTVNQSSGVLADETGSRRFLVTNINRIDLAYQTVDVNQVWAQAVATFQNDPTQAKLSAPEITSRENVNLSATVEFAYESLLITLLDKEADNVLPTSDIVKAIQLSGNQWSEAQHSALAKTLTHLGALRTETKVNGQRARGWKGVKLSALSERLFNTPNTAKYTPGVY